MISTEGAPQPDGEGRSNQTKGLGGSQQVHTRTIEKRPFSCEAYTPSTCCTSLH